MFHNYTILMIVRLEITNVKLIDYLWIILTITVPNKTYLKYVPYKYIKKIGDCMLVIEFSGSDKLVISLIEK